MTDTPHDPGSSADAPAQDARPSPGAPNNAIEIDSSQSRPRWSYPWFFLAVLCALLMGYALGGRGFAYIGVGKLYIGEVVFTLGVVAMVLTRRAWRCLVHPVWIILLMLLLWCGLRALPDLGRYGVLTLRDAAMAGYALFAAMVMLCLVSEPWWLGRLTRRLAHFGANGFFAVAPLLVLLTQLGGDALPHWPGAPGPLIQLKPGDAALEERAASIGRAFSAQVSRAPSAHSQLLCALDFGVGPSYEVVIAGNRAGGDTGEMMTALRRVFAPNKVVLFRPAGDSPPITELAAFTKLQKAKEGKATAYVCRNHRCKLPTVQPGALVASLNEASALHQKDDGKKQ